MRERERQELNTLGDALEGLVVVHSSECPAAFSQFVVLSGSKKLDVQDETFFIL